MIELNMILALVGMVAAVIATLAAMSKANTINALESEVEGLRKTLDEMDEQAKLVVRTDIELNKAQEELDRKVTSLYTLHQLSRTISATLEESQVFKRVELAHIEALGFQRALGFMFLEQEHSFSVRLAFGYIPEEAERIRVFLESRYDALADLLPAEKAFSSRARSNPLTAEIKKTFAANSFVLAPILPKEGAPGMLFVGSEKPDIAVTEGDEELITIVATQIGQALENARLFEKTWQAHQSLEKRVEERTRALSQALEEVKKLSQRKNDFVSNVSHELRAPLTSIKGYASILLSGKLGVLPDEVHRRLEKINKHSDELVSFVNDLLDISRIESGRVELKLAPYNLKNVVDEVADLLAVQCRERQINFRAEIADQAEVLVDYSQIKRVFINLINNAIKYTPANGTITVRVHKRAGDVQVDVQDTGCGIPANAIGKLFVEFYRVDSAQNQEIKGTGLGLALVKNIVEAHKGTVWVTSAPGEGATFSFTLPLA